MTMRKDELMIKMKKRQEGSTLTITLVGSLDATTSPELERELSQSLDGIDLLVLDMQGVDYVSSAGLRVLVWAKNMMLSQGDMKLVNVDDAVREVFAVTGFLTIMDVE